MLQKVFSLFYFQRTNNNQDACLDASLGIQNYSGSVNFQYYKIG